MAVVEVMLLGQIFLIDAVLSGQMPIPSSDKIKPRKVTDFAMRMHFSGFEELVVPAGTNVRPKFLVSCIVLAREAATDVLEEGDQIR